MAGEMGSSTISNSARIYTDATDSHGSACTEGDQSMDIRFNLCESVHSQTLHERAMSAPNRQSDERLDNS